MIETKRNRFFSFSTKDRAPCYRRKNEKSLVQKFSRECSTTTTTSMHARFFRERLVPEDDVLGGGYSRETFLVPDGMPLFLGCRSAEN